MVTFIKWSSLQKSGSEFMPKKFYEIGANVIKQIPQ
jgi:hypothetical protein